MNFGYDTFFLPIGCKNEICGLTDRKEIVENFTNYS